MTRLELAKQKYFKQFDQSPLGIYGLRIHGACFEAGYRECLEDIRISCHEQIVAMFTAQVGWGFYKGFADQEITEHDIKSCGDITSPSDETTCTFNEKEFEGKN